MLTDKDIQKLTGVFATKKDLQRLATKEDIKEVRKEIGGLRSYTEKGFDEVHDDHNDLKTMVQGLEVSVDGLAKSVDDLRIDHAAVLGTLDRHERWHKQTAEEIGIKLEG